VKDVTLVTKKTAIKKQRSQKNNLVNGCT